MEFFNQKEEVIDLVLTKKGKTLLSQGKFKPYGYKFFDDKVVYQINNELQNDIVPRIKSTPYLKSSIPVSVYQTGIPKNPNVNIVAPYGFFNFQDLQNELGQSDQFTEYSPAWNVQFLEASGAYVSSYLSSSINNSIKLGERIPQFNVDVNYKIAVVNAFYDEQQDKYFYSDSYQDKFNCIQLILQKDQDDIFIKATEQNSFIETQQQELTLEMYEYINQNGYFQELKNINMNSEEEESYSKYFTISFDNVADLISEFNTKNIYKEDEENVCE